MRKLLLSLFSLLLLSVNARPTAQAEILVATGSEIVKLAADGSGATSFVPNATFGLFYDATDQLLYYTGSSDSIRRANRDGSNPTVLVANAGNTVVDLVVDHSSSPAKIIWTDLSGFQIRRSNLDGSSVENLITGISEPHGLLLDSTSNKVYWSDALGISRANVDGSSQELSFITDTGGPIKYMALQGGKIYWSNATDNTIKRANTDGTAKETIVSSGAAGAEGIAYDATLGKLFFIGIPSGGVGLRKVDLDGNNLEPLGSQNGYDILVNYSTTFVPPTATPTATATATATNTITPTASPSPTATSTPQSLPAALCVTFDSGDRIDTVTGTYFLSSGSSQSFYYYRNGRQYLAGYGGGDAFIRVDYREYDDNILSIEDDKHAPVGRYTGQVDSKKSILTLSVLVTQDACPAETPTPLPSTSITGKVVKGPGGSSLKTFAAAGNIYALLYAGASPTEGDGSGLPITGALVDENDTYLFENVAPGDYHIKFLADDVKFTSSFISISALTAGVTTAPESSAEAVSFKDTGCTKKDISSLVYSSTDSLVKLQRQLKSQISDNKLLGYSKLKSGKLNTFLKSLQKLNTQISKAYLAGVKITSALPLVSRSKCPKANACKIKNYSKSLASLKGAFDKLYDISTNIQKLSATAISGKGPKTTNSSFVKKIKKAHAAAAKIVAKLPAEISNCPEI